jgi:hypothetical protein
MRKSDGRVDCDHVPACRRGAMTAGPDGVRDPVPNTDAASQAVATSGFLGSSVRPIVISFSSFTLASRRGSGVTGCCRSAVTRVVVAHANRAISLSDFNAALNCYVTKSRSRHSLPGDGGRVAPPRASSAPMPLGPSCWRVPRPPLFAACARAEPAMAVLYLASDSSRA